MTHTVPNGTTYNIHVEEVEIGYTGRTKIVWVADNFAYHADTKEELVHMLDYMTETWTHQTID